MLLRGRRKTRLVLGGRLCVISLAAGMCAQSPEARLTIEQAVTEALERNLGLLAERANIAIAEARVLTARLRPNPVLSVGGDHMDLLGTGFSDLNAGGPTEFSLRTDFLWERGDKRRLRTEVAEAARSVARLQFLNSVRGVVLEVQNTFVDALLARDNLALARENLQSLNQIVDINSARVQAGDLAEVELIRSRLAALQFENSVRQAELRWRAALVRLQTLLGRPKPSPGFDLIGALRRDPPVGKLEDWQKAAQELRPDLGALRQDSARADAELRSQIAQGKVDYTLGTEYRRQQVAAKSNSLGVFFSLPLPVFNRNQGEIERTRQEGRQIQLRIRALEATITGEVENAHQQLLTARSLLDAIEGRMVAQARDVREITAYSYQRGEATLLQLLDAQRAFNETMQAYHEARAEYARSLYLLDSISGKVVTR